MPSCEYLTSLLYPLHVGLSCGVPQDEDELRPQACRKETKRGEKKADWLAVTCIGGDHHHLVLTVLYAHVCSLNNETLLLTLLHCLYEAQDSSLCQFVASELKGEPDLSGNSLSLVDCIAFGYLI